mgnify:CR=1 FL=1
MKKRKRKKKKDGREGTETENENENEKRGKYKLTRKDHLMEEWTGERGKKKELMTTKGEKKISK